MSNPKDKLLRCLEAWEACEEAQAWAAEAAWDETSWLQLRQEWREWLLHRIGLRAEYDRVKAAAWVEYDRATAAAWVEYSRVTAAAWVEYDRATAAAWVEYSRVCAAAIPWSRVVEALDKVNP